MYVVQLMAVSVLTPGLLVIWHRRFGEVCSPVLQGWRKCVALPQKSYLIICVLWAGIAQSV
jgi:hypothetical protein